ncbi:MAG: PqqD family protein [bacterium]
MKKQTIFKIKDEIAFRKAADGTTTIVSPATDKILTINVAATEIWEMLDGVSSAGVIAEKFASIHANEEGFPGKERAQDDALKIIEQFLNKKLIKIISGS